MGNMKVLSLLFQKLKPRLFFPEGQSMQSQNFGTTERSQLVQKLMQRLNIDVRTNRRRDKKTG